MPEPWASAAALGVGAFAGAFLVGWLSRSGLHAAYMALVVLVIALVAAPRPVPVQDAPSSLSLGFMLVAAVLGAAGFACGRVLRRRRAQNTDDHP